MPDTPISPMKGGGCCYIAPWEILEEGREYVLRVTEIGYSYGINGESRREVKILEPSNKRRNSFELHITVPEPEDGEIGYRKITSNHKFLCKECVATMMVKSDLQALSIPEGGSFEVGAQGVIKDAPFYREDVKDPERVVSRSTFAYIINSIVNPRVEAKKIEIYTSGLTACGANPKVNIYVHRRTEYSGEVSLSYGFAYTTAEKLTKDVGKYRNERIEVKPSAFKAEGRFELIRGSTRYVIEPFYGKNIDKDENRASLKLKRKVADAKGLFSTLQEGVNSFHRFFENAQKAQTSPITNGIGPIWYILFIVMMLQY